MEKETPTPIDSSKPYNLSFEYRPQYLYVFVTGEKDSCEISRQYRQEIADECAGSGIKKRLLIEEDIAENISMHDTRRLASEIPQPGFFAIRVAFADRREDQHQLNQFGETVATNRGLSSRVFNDFAEAEKWLLSE